MKSARRMFLMILSQAVFMAASIGAAERPFYQGKNVIFLINFAAGGPTDIEGRIVARHLAKHIAGNPAGIAQNMAGAGGVTGINFLGEAAKRDGLTLGYFTGPYNHQMMKSPSLRIDLMKVPFIASVQGVTVCYIRSDVPPGIKKPTDIARAERFRAGGLSYDSNKDLRGRGGGGEPQLVKSGIVTPLYYHDLISPDGTMRKSPDYPELSSFTEVYTQIFNKPPSGIKYEALKAANMASQNMNRVALLPPGSPPAAIAAICQAFP